MPLKNAPKPSVLFVASAMTLASPTASAYLDPSTSGMIISAVVGLLASAALAIKTYWYRIRAFFRSDQSAGSGQTAGDADREPAGEAASVANRSVEKGSVEKGSVEKGSG